MPFRDRVVVITGAAGGIGSALARRFARAGARLALLDVDAGGLARLRAELAEAGAAVCAHRCDVTDASACRAAIDAVVAAFGAIDVLVNNAGITALSPFAACGETVFHRLMAVNFFGAIHCTLAALPALRARKGQVVVISSVAGFAPLWGRAAYAASKHALHGAFDTLRVELAREGVGVSVVCPTYTDTQIVSRALDGEGRPTHTGAKVAQRMMAPAVLADRVVRALARRRRRVLPTWVARGAWWISRVAPALYDRLMLRHHRTHQGRDLPWSHASRSSCSPPSADSAPRRQPASAGS